MAVARVGMGGLSIPKTQALVSPVKPFYTHCILQISQTKVYKPSAITNRGQEYETPPPGKLNVETVTSLNLYIGILHSFGFQLFSSLLFLRFSEYFSVI